MSNAVIIGLVVAFIIVVCLGLFSSLDEEITDPHYIDDNFYDPYQKATLITPMVGALGGQDDFNHITDPAHYMMKSQLMNQSRRDLLLKPHEVKKMHNEHMNKHMHHLYGPHQRNDKIWHDSSPYADLAEIAEYKPPWSIAGASIPALHRYEEYRRQKNQDFDQSTLYEQDMADFGQEFAGTHATKTGTKPYECLFKF